MKIADLTCPGCGARLSVDIDAKQATCNFCGATFPIDDEMRKVKLTDAEQLGYEFEKGRQKAQAEAARQNAARQQYPNTAGPAYQQPYQKLKTNFSAPNEFEAGHIQVYYYF